MSNITKEELKLMKYLKIENNKGLFLSKQAKVKNG